MSNADYRASDGAVLILPRILAKIADIALPVLRNQSSVASANVPSTNTVSCTTTQVRPRISLVSWVTTTPFRSFPFSGLPSKTKPLPGPLAGVVGPALWRRGKQ